MLITAGTKINAYFLQRKVKKPIIFYFFFLAMPMAKMPTGPGIEPKL